MMKAAVIHEFGDFDVLRLADVATPKPKPGNVLVKVLAAGVNRLDHYPREGSVVDNLAFPHIPGADAAGEVFRLGKGVSGLEVGERVIPVPCYPQDEEDYDIYPADQAPSFALPGLQIPGTYAQYIQVPARFLLKDVTGLKPEEVATLPVALATAVRAVKELGGVKAHQSPRSSRWLQSTRAGRQDTATTGSNSALDCSGRSASIGGDQRTYRQCGTAAVGRMNRR